MWTGREAVVFGGVYQWGRSSARWVTYADGAAYDPARDSWRPIAASPLAPREYSLGVWTGTEFIVWGGLNHDWEANTFDHYADGAAYDPERDSWRVLASSPLEARGLPLGVWTGEELIVWGGGGDAAETEFLFGKDFVDGAKYSPATDRWTPIHDAPRDLISSYHGFSAVWTGDEMLVWDGNEFGELPSTASYEPRADEWRLRAPSPLPEARAGQTTVWTGTHLVVWGGAIGEGGNHSFNDGARYEPGSDTWELLPPSPLLPRWGHSGVWTGEELLLWGGAAEDRETEEYVGFVAGDGAAWRPAS